VRHPALAAPISCGGPIECSSIKKVPVNDNATSPGTWQHDIIIDTVSLGMDEAKEELTHWGWDSEVFVCSVVNDFLAPIARR
jgi:hypothetical protein